MRVTVVTSRPTREAAAPARERAAGRGSTRRTSAAAEASCSRSTVRSRWRGAALADATAAAQSFVDAKPADDRIAVRRLRPRPVELTGLLSRATRRRRRAGDDQRRRPRRAPRSTTRSSSRPEQLAAQPLGGRVLILLTDGNDISSVAIARRCDRGRAQGRRGRLPDRRSRAPVLARCAPHARARDGRRYHGASSTAALGAVYAAIARELDRTWRLSLSDLGAAPATRSSSRRHVAGLGRRRARACRCRRRRSTPPPPPDSRSRLR